ncbi:MAG: 2-C-methyl-D-erythritol 2,4-cyclodiphosphate synthase [Mycoplasmoidaceae bacterium]
MYRIGQSNDIHTLKINESGITLGGLKIKTNFEIVSYSDGDVVLHALADAIYGALGLGDLGDHFKDNDEKNRNLSSTIILEDALTKMKFLNYEINNLDLTIICEKIYLGNYKKEIAHSLKQLTGCKHINVKATRWEEDKNTIQCNCIVLLRKEDSNEQ